jgi:Flp pilus assembly protein TadG
LELALAIPVVMVLFMGIFEFGRLFYARVTMQHAIAEAARFAVTGGTLNDAQGNPLTRAESIVAVIKRQAIALDVDVDNLTINPPDGGGPSQVVTVSGDFSYDFVTPGIHSVFPDAEYTFTVSTSLKNEPCLEH